MTQPKKDDSDWVDHLTAAAGALGFNPIRVRWKLEALRKKTRATAFRATEHVEHVKYQHKICPSCGRLNDGGAAICVRCEKPLGAHQWHVLQRIGLSLPEVLSISSLLGTAMVLVYGRLIMTSGDGGGIFSLDVLTLLRCGGSWAPAVFGHNEYWRLGTAIFLHAGLWHIGFNLIALSQIGPTIEEIFGRGRMLLFFMLTGLLASLGSALYGAFLMRSGVPAGVSIGASGAVMGLIGLAAGWGHREGTSAGRDVRSRMLKWCVYVLIFGFFIGADNVAHVVGFVAGGALGLVVPTSTIKKSVNLPLDVAQTSLGALAAIASIALCLFTPASPAVDTLEQRMEESRTPESSGRLSGSSLGPLARPSFKRSAELGVGETQGGELRPSPRVERPGVSASLPVVFDGAIGPDVEVIVVGRSGLAHDLAGSFDDPAWLVVLQCVAQNPGAYRLCHEDPLNVGV